MEGGRAPAARDAAHPVGPAATAPARRTALTSVPAHLRFWLMVVGGLALDLWSKDWAFRTLGQTDARVLIPHVLELRTTLNPGALFGLGAGRTEIFLIASVLALVLVLWMFAHSEPRRWLMHIGLGAILAGALGNMYDRMFVKLVELPPAVAGGPRFYQVAANGQHDGADGQRVAADGQRDPAPAAQPGRGSHGDDIVLLEYPPTPDSRVRRVPAEAARDLQPVGFVRDFIKIPKRWLGGREMWPWVFNIADALLVGGVAVLIIRMLRERRRQPGDAVGAAGRLDAAAENT